VRIAAEEVDRLRRLFARDDCVVGLTIDGRYQMIRRIGQGDGGDVFTALDQRRRRTVALKVLSAHRPRLAWIAAFRAEARTLNSLEHPGIVPVYDVGTLPDGRVYFTRKLVGARTFDRHLRSGTDRRTLIRLLADACLTVHRAHEAGVLHRDLKPANFMADDAGRVFVMDWGIGPSGTAAYLAPEQAWGFDGKVDRRTDVYGLGAVLYELLTGRPPIEGRTEFDRLMAARLSRIPPLRSGDLEAVCLKALRPDRRARYATARDLREDLVRSLEGRPIESIA